MPLIVDRVLSDKKPRDDYGGEKAHDRAGSLSSVCALRGAGVDGAGMKG
jgi:hypothetical protein